MFCKLSLLALVTPLVSALTLQVPENPTSGGSITIKWGSAQNDPDTWTFELTNPSFNQAIAIANNVNPTAGQLTLTLPIVPPGNQYTIQAVNIGDINDVFAATPNFSIGASTASVSSASSTSSGTASKSSSSSASLSSVTTPATSSTPAATSNIVSNTDSSSSSSTSSGTAAPTGATPFSGALSSRLGSSPAGGIAAVLLSVVAGAAMIAL